MVAITAKPSLLILSLGSVAGIPCYGSVPSTRLGALEAGAARSDAPEQRRVCGSGELLIRWLASDSESPSA